jgi:hypothetical protein
MGHSLAGAVGAQRARPAGDGGREIAGIIGRRLIKVDG